MSSKDAQSDRGRIDSSRLGKIFLCAAAALCCAPAYAYVGPGAGLGVIGTLFAFFGAVLLAIVGFVWYPMKRLLKRKGARAAAADGGGGQGSAAIDGNGGGKDKKPPP